MPFVDIEEQTCHLELLILREKSRREEQATS
jgi:hypothetical protein